MDPICIILLNSNIKTNNLGVCGGGGDALYSGMFLLCKIMLVFNFKKVLANPYRNDIIDHKPLYNAFFHAK